MSISFSNIIIVDFYELLEFNISNIYGVWIWKNFCPKPFRKVIKIM